MGETGKSRPFTAREEVTFSSYNSDLGIAAPADAITDLQSVIQSVITGAVTGQAPAGG